MQLIELDDARSMSLLRLYLFRPVQAGGPSGSKGQLIQRPLRSARTCAVSLVPVRAAFPQKPPDFRLFGCFMNRRLTSGPARRSRILHASYVKVISGSTVIRWTSRLLPSLVLKRTSSPGENKTIATWVLASR
jgi:hypothetical protein